MRDIPVSGITAAVKKLCIDSNFFLGKDIYDSFHESIPREQSELGKDVFKQLIENADISAKERVPICQDTGFAVVFIELGQEAHITGGSLTDAVNQGVREGYSEGYLRKSILKDPIDRVNTKDNTPAIIHLSLVAGDTLKITVAPKGGGSENMSKIAMLKPSDGLEGIKSFVLDTVSQAGSNPCPPIIVGVGIGGTFEYAAFLSKKALLRDIGERSRDLATAQLETDLLAQVNRLGIGPQGLGGTVTALDLFIERHPCHLASLPVAVNLNCHAARHKETVL